MVESNNEQLQQSLVPVEILRFREGRSFPVDDVVAREEPLEVRLNGSTLVYLMRLPGDDIHLAAGFCYSEGLVRERGQIESIEHRTDGGFSSMEAGDGAGDTGSVVEIRARLEDGADRFTTALVVRTGCGKADIKREFDLSSVYVESRQRFTPEVVVGLPDGLLAEQDVFRMSGGTHGAGVFNSEGELLVVKEDIGRHNAVDKALGHLLMSGEEAWNKGIIFSGRLSYEMVLKAARAGVPLMCSVSAPTALGVEVGRKTGVTLVGFLRGAGFNVYSHPSRIGGA